jgi:hypothetical protein
VPNYVDRGASVHALESQALFHFTGIGIGEVGSVEGGAGLVVTPSLRPQAGAFRLAHGGSRMGLLRRNLTALYIRPDGGRRPRHPVDV